MGPIFHYLVASLPSLRLGETPGLRSDDFLEVCGRYLEPEQQEILVGAGLLPAPPAPEAPHEALRGWYEFETDLRNHLARARAARRKVDAEPFLRPEGNLSSDMERAVGEALDQSNPEDGERRLDELRWRFLEDLTVGHPADMTNLLAYRLQLLLAEKWVDLDADQGLARLEQQAEVLRSALKVE
jgi:hypothetical protein